LGEPAPVTVRRSPTTGVERLVFPQLQQPGGAPLQPGMHPVAVEFDFMQPLRSVGWLVDELGELRFDPIRQRGRLRPLPSQQRRVTSKPPALAQTRETE
jgi:hypothetical protein